MTKVIFLSSISQSTGIEFLIRKLKVNTFLRKLEVIKGLLGMTNNLPKRFVDAPNWSTKDRGSVGKFLQFFALSVF